MPRLTVIIFCIVAATFLSRVGVASQTPTSTATAPTVATQTPTSTAPIIAPTITPATSIATAKPSEQTLAYAVERWYVISLKDIPVGWSSMQTKPIDGGFRTESQTRLRMAREKQILGMSTTAWIEEDNEGHMLRAGQSQTGGGVSVRVYWEKFENGVRERRTQGATVTERVLPAIDKDALAPVAALRAAQAAKVQGKTEFSLLILDPAQGMKPESVRWQKIDATSVMIQNKSVECERWKSTGPLIAAGSEECIAANGEILRSQVPTGLGVMQSVMCDKATAMAAIDVAKPPVEVMVASFVKADRPLVGVSAKRSITLLVKAKNPPIMPPPQEGFQRVKRNPDGSFLVTVNLDLPADPSPAIVGSDVAFLESSPMIDWNDPAVLALKKSAFVKWSGDPAAIDPLTRCKLLRAAVANHITNQNLGSAFASASETARTKSGDCTEHAVLLAALLRADGIPSRVAAGLVWAEFFAGETNVFAWHLWTQAFIDGRWVDLDSTLGPTANTFHAGHLLLAVTPLSEAASDPAWASLLSSMGNISIEVIDGAN
jgi:hypothetical protein